MFVIEHNLATNDTVKTKDKQEDKLSQFIVAKS